MTKRNTKKNIGHDSCVGPRGGRRGGRRGGLRGVPRGDSPRGGPRGRGSGPAAQQNSSAPQPFTPAAQQNTPAPQPTTPTTQQDTPAPQPATPTAQQDTPAPQPATSTAPPTTEDPDAITAAPTASAAYSELTGVLHPFTRVITPDYNSSTTLGPQEDIQPTSTAIEITSENADEGVTSSINETTTDNAAEASINTVNDTTLSNPARRITTMAPPGMPRGVPSASHLPNSWTPEMDQLISDWDVYSEMTTQEMVPELKKRFPQLASVSHHLLHIRE